MGVRRIAIAATSLMLTAGVMVGASGGAGAAVSTYRFKGSVSATITGAIKVTPALTLSPSAGPVTVRITAALTGLTGTTSQANNGGSTSLTGGAFRSLVTLPAGTRCLSLLGGIPSGAATLKWASSTTGTGLPAATSVISFGSGSLATTSPITATLGGPGTTTKGSFAKPTGGNSSATVVLNQTLNSLVVKCEGAGVSRLTFTGAKGTSTLTVG
jgi:hypothetical protein